MIDQLKHALLVISSLHFNLERSYQTLSIRQDFHIDHYHDGKTDNCISNNEQDILQIKTLNLEYLRSSLSTNSIFMENNAKFK